MIFHIDLDAFYASIEVRDNPSLKDKVVLIGSNNPRGVVTTCNYKAREYGIHSAMPMFKAFEKYKNPVIISPRLEYYKKVSDQIMNIFKSFTDKVYQISIDEAFLDLSDTRYLYHSVKTAAKLIKEKMKKEVNLTCSIGVSSSFYVAKMASGFRKPDGLTIVKDENILKFIDTIGLQKLWGVGEKSQKLLYDKAYFTTKQVRSCSKEELVNNLGNHLGLFLYDSVRGKDYVDFTKEAKSKSISKELTLKSNVDSKQELLKVLHTLCRETYLETLDKDYKAKSISIKIKYSDFTVTSKQTTCPFNLNLDLLYSIAKDLFLSKYTGSSVRLIGVSLNNLYNKNIQKSLFEEDEKKSNIDKLALELQKKGQILTKASLIKY